MYIGEVLKQRMIDLDIHPAALAEEALVDRKVIDDILSNKLSISEVDTFDLEFIARVLFCSVDYFLDETVRKTDIIHASMNRGESSPFVNKVKGQLQSFANDFLFLSNIMAEVKGGK